jgi:hypothetical protein
MISQVSWGDKNLGYVGGIKGFTPDTITPIYWIAFQIKKRGLLCQSTLFVP